MRIGIDAHILGKNQGGVERYVREIVTRVPKLLPHCEFYIFVTKNYFHKVENSGNRRYIPLPFSDPLIQRSIFLPFFVKKHQLDILHTQRIIPFFVNCKCIVSIHDILPLTTPENHRGLRDAIVRKLTPWSAKKAVFVLTVSETVKKEITSVLNIFEDKVKTIYNGIDHKTVTYRESDPLEHQRSYILYAGAIEPRKNLLTLIRGFHKAQKAVPDLTLVLAGMDRDRNYKKELNELAQQLKLSDKVKFTGFVEEAVLNGLYEGATLFVAPSTGEGFDLPPLEAMQKEIPVICSDIDVHREVIRDGALFFKKSSAVELGNKIHALIEDSDHKKKLIDKGLLIARQYTWEKTACQTAEVYLEAEKINR